MRMKVKKTILCRKSKDELKHGQKNLFLEYIYKKKQLFPQSFIVNKITNLQKG